MKIRASDKYIQRTPVFVQRKSCLVVVELDVEQFPLPNLDAGVAALMRLVAVLAAEVVHHAVISYGDFIDGKQTETFAFEASGSLLPCGFACLSRLVSSRLPDKETVLTQLFLTGLLLLRRGHEFDDHTAASQQIVIFAKANEHSSTLGPCSAITGAGIPWEREVMTAGHHHPVVVDDALTVCLVEEETV